MKYTQILNSWSWHYLAPQKLTSLSLGSFLMIAGLASQAQSATLSNVPSYNWYHGCVPTSAASIYGYWDLLGYSNLFDETGDIYLTSSVQEQISSTAHNLKYDPKPDNPNLPESPHTSLADFFQTSEGDLEMGWTYNSLIANGLKDYAKYRGYDFSTLNAYFGDTLKWDTLVRQIDLGLPAMFFVDTNQDGNTDHAVPVIGYEDRGSEGQFYGIYTTWHEEENITWQRFRAPSKDYGWGVGSGVFVYPSQEDTVKGTTVDAAFLNPQPSSPAAIYTGMGTNSITWGKALASDGDPVGSPSSLSFTGKNFSVDLDKPFSLGEITFHNGSIQIAPQNTGIEYVDLGLSLLVDIPNLGIFNRKITLPDSERRKVDIINTPNILGDPQASADYLYISPGKGLNIGNTFHVLEGGTATASLMGLITQVRSPSGFSFASNAEADPFMASATQDNEPEFVFKLLGFGEVLKGDGFITSTSVPEPSTLIGTSLAVGLAVLSRKQKRS